MQPKSPTKLRRQIGVVFQAQSIDVKLTAAENLWHQGHLYGLRGAALKSRIAEMLARVGLADRANEKAETFSGGMQRRLELAKGLLHHPAVLLLDEPTTGLDPGARRDLWQYLQILRDEEKVTVIVTTHLMEEAERCDRLAILNEGKLVALGTPTELKQRNRRRRDSARCPRRGIAGGTNSRPLQSWMRRCSGARSAWSGRMAIASSPTWSKPFPARLKRFRSASRRWKMFSSTAPAIDFWTEDEERTS